MLASRLVLGLLFAAPAVTAFAPSIARADLPEVAFGPVFERLCGELRATASCDECVCSAVTSSIADASADTPYVLIVKVEGKPGSDNHTLRYHVAAGSKDKLSDLGVLMSADSDAESTYYAEVEQKRIQTFDDTCLKCTHEGVGLVHLFDLSMRTTRMFQDAQYQMYEQKTELGLLLACFGAPIACYGTPLSMSEVTDQPPMAPGDKGKKGKKQAWSRSWKIGGKDKMQVVLSPLGGNAAASAKEGLDGDPREFNFVDLRTRATSSRLGR